MPIWRADESTKKGQPIDAIIDIQRNEHGHALASVANMRAYRDTADTSPNMGAIRCIACSPYTGEEYSADSGDYWDLPNNDILKDSDGNEMILVVPYRRDPFTGEIL